MHVPTLPSLPSWETPIAASREIVEAIADVADATVDAATSAVRSARRRRRTPAVVWAVVWVAIAVAALGLAAFVRARRNRERGPRQTTTGMDATLASAANGKDDASTVRSGDTRRVERPVGAGTVPGRSSTAD